MATKNFADFAPEVAPLLTDYSVGYRSPVSGGERRTLHSSLLALFKANLGAISVTSVNGVVLSGTGSPALAVTGSASVSGVNTGDQDLSGYLTTAAAAATYLTQANAAATYLTQANAAALYQPVDSDLSAIAALGTTSFGRNLLTMVDAAALRSVAGLGTAALLNAGVALGAATLDSSGKVPTSQLPDSIVGAVRYMGTWAASTNTPTLINPPAASTKGEYYIASDAGSFAGLSFVVGDWIISDGAAWSKVDNSDAVTTVFGRLGNIVAVAGDYTAAQVTSVPAGNLSALTVQAALNELDAEKQPLAAALTTLSGGSPFVQFIGPAGSVKQFTLPDASGTILTSASGVASIAGTANEIAASAAVGAVTLSLPAALTFTGKTVTGGTFNNPVLSAPALGTPVSGVLTNCTGYSANALTGTTLAANVVNASLNSITPTGGTLNVAGGVAATVGGDSITMAGGGVGYLMNFSRNNANYIRAGTAGGFFIFETGGANERARITDTGLSVPGGITANNFVSNAGATNTTGLVFNRVVGFQNLMQWQRASVPEWLIGTAPFDGALIGGTNDGDFVVRAQNSKRLLLSFDNGVTAHGVWSSSGLTVTGGISATNTTGTIDITSTTGTQQTFLSLTNGGGQYFFAVNNAAGGAFGGTPYSLVCYAPAGRVIQNVINGVAITTTSSTGLAVTGESTATGNITTYNGGNDGSGFFARSASHVFSLNRYDTLGSGSALLSAYGKIGMMVGATAGTYGTGLLVGTWSSTGLAVTGTIINTFSGLGTGHSIRNATDTSGALFCSFDKSSGAGIGSISRVGTTDAVAYNTTSDARLKENVRDFTGADSGPIIDGLRPRWFDWKRAGDDGQNIIGLIAQEEAAINPALVRCGAVTAGDDGAEIGKAWQRSDAALVPILIAELKAMRARLAALEAAHSNN